MTLGAFAGVHLTTHLADHSFLSPAVPADGRGALVIGGIAVGGLAGLFLPLLVLGLFGGTAEKPRLRPTEAVRKMLTVLVIGVYLVLVSGLVAQLARIFPEGLTVLLSVFAVGFGWIPLALLPWQGFGLADISDRSGSRGEPKSHEPD
ncbi:hypothetical protein ACIP79_16105 [Streptomyces sp. NPDC088747]|uniref:hypothetical protein n=1 Tax=Streptomyces sp. NPDC088747 TaxID=3365886 RepID=UPI003806E583